MKRLTLAFLTLLAVLPSLMCFMVFCPMQSAQASEPIPCHEQAEESDENSAMLMSDCMGVDFFYQNASNDFQLDQQLDTTDFAWIYISAVHGFEPQNTNVIRGPPFIEVTRNPSVPVYLTTQRLRI